MEKKKWNFKEEVEGCSKKAMAKRSSLDKNELKAMAINPGFLTPTGTISDPDDSGNCGWACAHESGHAFAIFPGQLAEAAERAGIETNDIFKKNEDDMYVPKFKAFKVSKEAGSSRFIVSLAS